MCCRCPPWLDEFVLALEWAATPAIDGYLARVARDHDVPGSVLTRDRKSVV